MRVRDLTIKLDQLRARHGELDASPDATPAAPSPAAIQRLRDNLATVLTNGTPGQRKAIRTGGRPFREQPSAP